MSSNDGQESNNIYIMLGVILSESAMLYGWDVTLVVTYIPLLLQTSQRLSRHMRNFLLVYVTFMVAVSTVNSVTLIIAFAIGHNIFTKKKRIWPDYISEWISWRIVQCICEFGCRRIYGEIIRLEENGCSDHFIFSARYLGVWCCGL